MPSLDVRPSFCSVVSKPVDPCVSVASATVLRRPTDTVKTLGTSPLRPSALAHSYTPSSSRSSPATSRKSGAAACEAVARVRACAK
ncbi:hypothetical protein LTR53_019647, partial [Teratosphaeriaceae sp. CCFEE 6253]